MCCTIAHFLKCLFEIQRTLLQAYPEKKREQVFRKGDTLLSTALYRNTSINGEYNVTRRQVTNDVSKRKKKQTEIEEKIIAQ